MARASSLANFLAGVQQVRDDLAGWGTWTPMSRVRYEPFQGLRATLLRSVVLPFRITSLAVLPAVALLAGDPKAPPMSLLTCFGPGVGSAAQQMQVQSSIRWPAFTGFSEVPSEVTGWMVTLRRFFLKPRWAAKHSQRRCCAHSSSHGLYQRQSLQRATLLCPWSGWERQPLRGTLGGVRGPLGPLGCQ